MFAVPLVFWAATFPPFPAVTVEDADRFGRTRQQVQQAMQFNRDCRTHAEAQWLLAPHRATAGATAVRDLKELWALYDLLDDGLCVEFSAERRCESLVKLRETIGYRAYYEGRLPCVVPLWLFREIE